MDAIDLVNIGLAGWTEHRGTRVPSMMSVQGILSGLNFIVRPLYRAVAAEVESGMKEQFPH